MSSADGTITYRRADLSDYDAVMAIGSIYGGRDYLWSLYKQLVTDPDKYGIVALDGDRVVGFYMTSTFDGGRTVLKRSGRVLEEYRGRGIFHTLEAELDKHTLAHRPRAMYDVFANTEHEDHLSGKFLDMGFQEVCRKNMYHMILTSSELQWPRDRTTTKPLVVKELNTEDLKLLFNTKEVTSKLFPSGRLLNTYMPYRLLDVNIPYIICERGGAFVSFDNPDATAVRHSLRDREVRDSIPGRVKPRTLKLVLAADPPSVWHHGFSVKPGWPGVRIT
ncbi:histidine N-acetyltransferase-like [Elysia marginata]|uniref:Histidine N-acetyltransferase-like n=1 Tax=Elysia marginata TaxID=1093978 RepID=A0AAV4FTJ6_9GAST|nr:histidine N-acetyltransferase-like [Elysia marginata]